MSQITNRIATVYSAHAGNAIAVQAQIAGGMQNIGRQAMMASRHGGLLDNQLRAIGTTWRYMVAGSLVFGAGNMVRTLRDTQRQLALIGAIGDDPFDTVGRSAQSADAALSDLYLNAQRGSLAALTPVNEFNDALVNLYSTVQGLRPDQAVQMTQEIARGAQLAQVGAEDLTKAVAGMTQAFDPGGHTVQGYGRFIRGFYTLTATAPGGISAGPAIIQQLAPLAAVSRFASIKPDQMFGLYLTALRTGGSPATAGRGLQYLLQSLAVPASDESRTALRAAGITPDTVQQRGGLWALQRAIQHARGLGLRGEDRLAGLSDEQLDLIDSQGGDPKALQGLGISGRGLAWLSEAIGRIHGIRSLVTLTAQGPGRMQRDIALMETAMGDTVNATAEFRREWEDFARRSPLQTAAVSLDVIRRQIASAFEPLVNYPARQLGRAAPYLMDNENNVNKGIYAGAGLLAAYGITRKAGGLRNFGGGISRVAVGAQAVGALGNEGLGASPMNPMFVTVVNELVGMGGRGRGPASGGGAAGRAGRWGGRFGILGGAAGLIAAAGRGGLRGAESLFNRGVTTAIRRPWMLKGIPGVGAAASFFLDADEAGGGRTGNEGLSRAGINFMAAQRFNPNISHLYRTQQTQVRGRAMIELDVLVRQPDGSNERKRVHIPMDLWSGGRTPSYRGQGAKTQRRN